jgi:ketosteroid isomerase-like protein
MHTSSRTKSRPTSRLLAAVTVVLAIALPGTRAAAQASRGAAADSARVAAVLTAVFAAQERGDMAALDTLYAGESLTVIEGASINRGWADFREHHLGPELKAMKNLQLRPSEIEVHVDGRTAWALFRYTQKAEGTTRTIDSLGRGTAIFERTNGRWVLRHYHAGGRARRPTDPA